MTETETQEEPKGYFIVKEPGTYKPQIPCLWRGRLWSITEAHQALAGEMLPKHFIPATDMKGLKVVPKDPTPYNVDVYRELEYLRKRVKDLELENEMLKGAAPETPKKGREKL